MTQETIQPCQIKAEVEWAQAFGKTVYCLVAGSNKEQIESVTASTVTLTTGTTYPITYIEALLIE